MHEEQERNYPAVNPSTPSVAEPAPDVAAAPGPVIARLTGAKMPADRGMSSLGLLMQLGGTIGMTLAGVILIVATFGGGSTGMFFFIALLWGLRSWFHRAAGTSLLYERDKAFTFVKAYIWLSLAQSVLCILILRELLSWVQLVQLGSYLAAWPLALLVYFSLPHIRTLVRGGLPDAEDHGFEGAAVLMSLFGIIGALFAGLLLTSILKDPSEAFSTPGSGIIALIVIALLVRSGVHVAGGLKGTSGATFDEYNTAASRYYNMGVVSALCIGVTLFMVVLMSSHSMGGALLASIPSTALLLAWPLILRRLFAERNFLVLLAGSDAATFQRAPDAGLIALGWILVALGTLGVAGSLANALWQPPRPDELAAMAIVGGKGTIAAARSAWWSVGVGGLQLWAGIELVRMGERHKIAALTYGVATTAMTLYVLWPALDMFESMMTDVLGRGDSMLRSALTFGAGINLILAIGTIVLVSRVTVPSAVAQFRGTNKAA